MRLYHPRSKTKQKRILFKEIMPTKQCDDYHYALVKILKPKNHDLARMLERQLDILSGRKSKTSFSRSLSSSMRIFVQLDELDLDQFDMETDDGFVVLPEIEDVTRPLRVADFADEKYLGQGTYAKVFEMTVKKTGQRVAVKKLMATLNNEDSWKREVAVLRQAHHPHIVSIRGVVENLAVEEVWIITELMDSGSLRAYCTGNKKDDLSMDQKLDIGIHCWSALAYLHLAAKITHKDIKPENILLHKLATGDLIAKLCDFGLAEVKTSLTITEETKLGGTYMYYPPEYAVNQRNPEKSDVYSMGATLCELMTGVHFWHDPLNGKRINDFQILFKLGTIQNNLTVGEKNAEHYGPAAHALDGVAACPAAIKAVLKSTVLFDRHSRPDASSVLAVFEDMKSSIPEQHSRRLPIIANCPDREERRHARHNSKEEVKWMRSLLSPSFSPSI